MLGASMPPSSARATAARSTRSRLRVVRRMADTLSPLTGVRRTPTVVTRGVRRTPPGEAGLMKAIVQDGYGGPDGLRYEEVARPEVSGDRVLVRVRAAALNAYDWHVMRGDPRFARLSMGL